MHHQEDRLFKLLIKTLKPRENKGSDGSGRDSVWMTGWLLKTFPRSADTRKKYRYTTGHYGHPKT